MWCPLSTEPHRWCWRPTFGWFSCEILQIGPFHPLRGPQRVYWSNLMSQWRNPNRNPMNQNLPWELAGCVKTLSRYSQQKQERMDGSVFSTKKLFPRSPVKHRGSGFLPSFFFNRMFPMWGLRPKKRFWVVSIPNLATNGNHTLLLRIPPALILYTLSETNSSHLKLMVVILLSFWEGFLAGANCQF